MNLESNLRKKDDSDSEEESSRIIPVTCGDNFESVKESISLLEESESFFKDNKVMIISNFLISKIMDIIRI